MANIIPVKAENLPVRAPKKSSTSILAAAISSGGYKVISIKGSKFHIVDGDLRTLITREEGEPAANIETIILAANPHKSKVYYAGGYTEGSTDKPLCYSNNGETPEADAQEPQAKKCATCPHNVFGSKITENGKKAKSCSDSMRLAVVPADMSDDPMLLRVPAASIMLLGKYAQFLNGKGYDAYEVVTKIGFDHTVAYPALTFKCAAVLDETGETARRVAELRDTEVVQQIIGAIPTPHADADEEFVLPPKAEAKVVEKAAAKPAAKPAPVADDDEFPAEAPVKVKQEAKKAAKPAPAEEDVADVVGELVDSADDLDFDD